MCQSWRVEDQSHVIVVIRHAKAEQVGSSDFERELAPRGRADAAELGEWLAGRGVSPDHALVSAATRARQTWASVAGGAGWNLEPDVDHGLYVAGPETALDILGTVSDNVRTLVVVGHNPSMATLAQLLDDGEGDVAATNELATGYPTSAATVFSYDGSWADLGPATATVTGFHVGRG